jgi:hypothetical protein
VAFRELVRLRTVVRLAVLRLREVPFRLRVAAAFFAARDLTAAFRLRVAAAFRAAVDRFLEVVFLAVVFLLRTGAFLRPAAFLRAATVCQATLRALRLARPAYPGALLQPACIGHGQVARRTVTQTVTR